MISICESAFVERVLESPPFRCGHVRAAGGTVGKSEGRCVCADHRGFVWRNGTRYFWKRWRCEVMCVRIYGFLIGGSEIAITALLHRFQYSKT